MSANVGPYCSKPTVVTNTQEYANVFRQLGETDGPAGRPRSIPRMLSELSGLQIRQTVKLIRQSLTGSRRIFGVHAFPFPFLCGAEWNASKGGGSNTLLPHGFQRTGSSRDQTCELSVFSSRMAWTAKYRRNGGVMLSQSVYCADPAQAPYYR